MDINDFPLYYKDHYQEYTSEPASIVVARMAPKDRVVLNNPEHRILIEGLLLIYNIQDVRFFEIRPDELMELPFTSKGYDSYYDHDPSTLDPYSGLITRWGAVRC